MNLCEIGHDFRYESEKLIRIFLPFEKINFYSEKVEDTRAAILERQTEDGKTVLSVKLIFDGAVLTRTYSFDNTEEDYSKYCERKLSLMLFECFVEVTGYKPEWGILTGIRPAKLFSRIKEMTGSEEKASDYFRTEFMVSDNKISLCKEALAGEEKIIALSRPESFSLYLSVPFCPTRCHYCSFVSHSVESAKKLIPEYLELLCKELEATAKLAREKNLRLETVYIGGGTPTTFNAEQLTKVMNTVRENFDLSNLLEYTVEAGRPDTVTAEKLIAIKNGGATRISINPQTMQDEVLDAIGRRHTSKQTVEAFHLARSLGFDNINMDLIAGLPKDTFEGFKDTLEKVLELNPESVTVHSLSMKRSSTLTADGKLPEVEIGVIASDMVNYAREKLTENGIVPYYMYRQSKTVGNLENVGYAKKGFESLYNVFIMDETHTILACGASAVTKLREPEGEHIERIFNFKYPFEYINRYDEQMERKKGILDFYEKYPANHK